MRNRPTCFRCDAHRSGDGTVHRGLHQIVIPPVGQERGKRRDQGRTRDRRREQNDDGTGQAAYYPAEAGAEREKIGAGRDATKRKRQRELILSEPFALADKLTVDRGSGRASPAEGQVGVACENEGELAQ
jgi:hypothetical protein